mmetsp:Transcript_15631/g.38357  ORF Transcript_15631/g.38357 Transcript_15631/m.38357 type:complete len:151 (+) Transcript_15631:41-493(+)
MAALPEQHFDVDVVVGGQPLAKIAGKDGKTWVVARFDHAGVTKMVESEQQDPHGEVYNEKWPATPFTIRITNRSYPGPAEAQVFVDGRLAAVRMGAPAPDPRMRLKTFQSNCNTFPDCHCCQSARPIPRPRTAIVASALPCVRLLGDARA